MNKIHLPNILLNAGLYSVYIVTMSNHDLDISFEIDNSKFPTKILYESRYNEIGTKKKYTTKFNVNNCHDVKFSYQINNPTCEYEVLNCEIFDNSDQLIYSTNTVEHTQNIIKSNLSKSQSKYEYPLISKTFDEKEIMALVNFLTSGSQLTMGNQVENFENEFAKYIGANHAVMVNSGSSANLLAVSAITNFMFKNHLNQGDEVLVPTLCWSTSVWPLIQCNLVPVFVDVNAETMNINEEDIEKYITPKTKAIMLVHVMGNCCNMNKIMELVKKHKLLLIEDTCESLGSSYNGKKLGAFGTFGTYSFYYSHHITTIEGGMVITNSKEEYDLLRCLRAHGWTRYFDDNDKQKFKELYPNIDERYMFVNLGYNLRPMEMQAVMGRIQLQKLDEKNKNRIYNFSKLSCAILNHPKNNNLIILPKQLENTNACWFGLCIFLNTNVFDKRNDFVKFLELNSIENRPIITGNFVRQPYFISNNYNFDPLNYPNSDYIHNCGLYIGLSCEKYSDEKIEKLVNTLFNFF